MADELDADDNFIGLLNTMTKMTEAPGVVFAKDYEDNVRPLIDLIDRLRHIGLDKEIGLPSIAVVGDQSAGKSSVLEAISGVQLPRGTGIVTRCPLELRLKRDTSVAWEGCISYGETSEALEDFSQVEKHVRTAQNELAGGKKRVSDELISLEIKGPNLPDLTLIDLPGIIRVTVEGQDVGDKKKIRDLINKYIQKKETIILAVVPATTDIATCEALQVAKEVDPEHSRTLGVLTKVDLVDKGAEEEVLSILHNDKYLLSKGYIAVKCRGQNAINSQQTLQSAIDEEEQFFNDSEHYSEIRDLCGIKTLSFRLAQELVEQIKAVLPTMKTTIYNKLEETKKALLYMGEGIPEKEQDRQFYLVTIINGYTGDLKKLKDGNDHEMDVELRFHNKAKKRFEECARTMQGQVPQNRHVGCSEAEKTKRTETASGFTFGAPENTMKTRNVFTVPCVPNSTEAGKRYEKTIAQIQTAIEEDRGRELPHFMKFGTCKRFICETIHHFRQPAFECMHRVMKDVESSLIKLAGKHFTKFPALETRIKMLISRKINEVNDSAEKAIQKMFTMEEGIFVQPQTYNKTYDCIQEDIAKRRADQKQQGFSPSFTNSDKDKRKEAEDMYIHIHAYLEVCLVRIADVVPMIIMHHCILELSQITTDEVHKLIPNADALRDLSETPALQVKRRKLHDSLMRLIKGREELENI